MADFEYVNLKDDLEHYGTSFAAFNDHRYPRNARVAWVPMVLQHGNIQTSISKLERSGESMRVLGIGSGTGVGDCKLITGLLERYQMIHSTVVEPNKHHLRQHQETVSSTENLKKADWDWRQQSWDEFLTHRMEKNDSSKFDVITSLHSIYYMQGGLNAAVDGMVDCLKDNGVLLICLEDKDNAFNKITNWPWNKYHEGNLSYRPTLEIRKSLERRGLLCEIAVFPEFWDVTNIFERRNERDARHLEDFMTHVVNFKERAPSNIYDDFMKRLQEPRTTYRENGRIIVDINPNAIIAGKTSGCADL